MTLPLLLQRVREAGGPDRELDRAVALHFGWTDYDDGMGVMTRMRDPEGVVGAHYAPSFSASLDAAVALVERVRPETHWLIQTSGKIEDHTFDAEMWSGGKGSGFHQGATPALALLAALLASLTQEAHDDDPEAHISRRLGSEAMFN